ncbi:MAG: hypothetical protein AB7K68_14745 [Bacteriovoracia bacterium]
MLRLALTVTALLAAQNAAAYTPELLLQKSAARVPELEEATSRQFLNPVSEIKLGFEHSWGDSLGRSETLVYGNTPTDRIKTRIRDRDESEYANKLSLELKPKGIFEAISYYKYEKTLKSRTALERKILQSKSAKAAHELLARAAQAREEQALLNEWNLVLDRSQRLSGITARSEGDAKAVLKAAGEIDKAKNEMAEISSIIAGVNHSLSRRGLTLNELEIDQVVSAQDIGERLKGMTDISSLTSEDVLNDLTVERARHKYGLEKNSKWIDGIKFSVGKGVDSIKSHRYDQYQFDGATIPDSNQFPNETRRGTSYSLGITFNLPFLAAGDLDEQRDRIKVARLEVEAQVESDEAGEHAAALREIVKEKVAAYLNSSEGKANITDSLLRNDPALAMELQRASISKRLYRIKLLGEIRTLYIEFLYETGRLAEDADLNHLSKTNRRIGA